VVDDEEDGNSRFRWDNPKGPGAFFGRGNTRLAGLVLNFLALVPASSSRSCSA
jgi:hypothetical protein